MSKIEQLNIPQKPRYGAEHVEPRHNYEEITQNININRKCAQVFRNQVEKHLRGDCPYGLDIMIRDKVTEVSYTPFPEDKIGRYCTPIFMGQMEGEFKKGIANVFGNYVRFSDDRKKIVLKV